MKSEIVQELTSNFEGFAKKTGGGVEFWLARDIQSMLGYAQGKNFQQVIAKAKQVCEGSVHKISDHFADISKTINICAY